VWRGYANVLRGWTAAEDGHSEEGIALVQEGIADLDALGTRLRRSYHFGLLATIHARRGDLVAALASLERAHEEVSSTEVRFFEAELRRLGGELRALSGAPESEVEACFAEALAVARQQGARSFELRAATSLARRWRDRGKCVEARNLLTPIHGWFTEGHDTPDIRDAASLLETLQ
jgi:predicted ATPase